QLQGGDSNSGEENTPARRQGIPASRWRSRSVLRAALGDTRSTMRLRAHEQYGGRARDRVRKVVLALEAIEMRKTTLLLAAFAVTVTLSAQPPPDPQLLIPEQAPPLGYRWVAEPLSIPEDVAFGLPASVTFDEAG